MVHRAGFRRRIPKPDKEMSGNPDFDMVSVTRVDALTIHSTETKAGATVGNAVRTSNGEPE